MTEETVLTDEQVASELAALPQWEVRDNWLRRKYATPGWSHTLLLANTIGYVAEAAWHHPDLELGYAQVIVRIQTHRVCGLTASDFALAHRIEEISVWKPPADSPLTGFPKNWVH